MPSTLPEAAPISRFMLTSWIRNSKATTAIPQITPTAIAAGPSKRKRPLKIRGGPHEDNEPNAD